MQLTNIRPNIDENLQHATAKEDSKKDIRLLYVKNNVIRVIRKKTLQLLHNCVTKILSSS